MKSRSIKFSLAFSALFSAWAVLGRVSSKALAAVLLVMAAGIGNSAAQPFVIHDGPLPASQPGPPPAKIPGTGTVTVHARGLDGSIPVGGYCWVTPDAVRSLKRSGPFPPDFYTNLPTVVGSNGDWVVYNVTPFASGAWAVQISCSNYIFTSEFNFRSVEPISDKDVSLSFTLRLGATVTGRVLDAETGKPILGATIVGGGLNTPSGVTGADGRFSVQHLATNEAVNVVVSNTDYVRQVGRPSGLTEGMATTLSDVKLRHGGWISGRMTLPTDAPPGASPVLDAPTIEGDSVPTDYPETYGSNGVFRIGPLPAGTVGLSADSFLFKSGNPWRAEGAVTNIHVEAGHETKNVLIELKTTRPSNGR